VLYAGWGAFGTEEAMLDVAELDGRQSLMQHTLDADEHNLSRDQQDKWVRRWTEHVCAIKNLPLAGE
jgi:hypothetical protein